MRKENKKMNNKGFSLVELIVVIAIMAILIGVVGPQVMKQIDKSRESKDKSNIDTLFTAVGTAIADPDLYDDYKGSTLDVATGFTYSDLVALTTGDGSEFAKEIIATAKIDIPFSSNEFEDVAATDITITIGTDNKVTVTVTGTTSADDFVID